jgi:hypothetical protein
MTIDSVDLTGLQTKAILANVSIGTWSGRRFDNEATDSVADKFNADSDCGRFNKLLVDHDAILELFRLASRARKFHYDHTLPWNDIGTRLLPTKAYFAYLEGINAHADEFWKTVEKFYEIYPSLVEKRKLALGNLWKASDYPTLEELKSKFSFTVSFAFLPDPNSDFRLGLNEIEVEKIRESMAQSQQKVVDTSVRDLWQRMQKVVDKIVERLGETSKGFKNATFDKIEDLEQFIDMLNLTDDTNVSSTMEQIKVDLREFSPEIIRSNKKVRESVHKKAKDILDKINSFV